MRLPTRDLTPRDAVLCLAVAFLVLVTVAVAWMGVSGDISGADLVAATTDTCDMPCRSAGPLARVPLRDNDMGQGERVPLPPGLRAAVRSAMEKDAYQIRQGGMHSPVAGSHQAVNRAQRLRFGFSGNGIHVRPRCTDDSTADWELDMRLCGIGYGDLLQTTSQGRLSASGNRIDYQRLTSIGKSFTEWYVNTPRGLEQGFTLPTRPGARRSPEDPLRVELRVSGKARPRLAKDRKSITFVTADGKQAFRYSELHAYDARGKELPSHMVVQGECVALAVDDSVATYPLTIDPLFTTETKLRADDAADDDRFGWSVALSGDTALVGAPGDDDGGDSSGSAYVFVRQGLAWSQQAKLTATDASALDQFGFSVALSGDTVLVGAFQDNDRGTASGSVYVFVRNNTVWSQQTKLTANDGAAFDNFGHGVALSGDTALVGAPRHNPVGFPAFHAAGSTYVFVRSGTTWSRQAKLIAQDTNQTGDEFGFSVAVSGDTALVGAPFDDDGGTDSGSAYVFVRSGTVWSQQAELRANDAATSDEFGYSVALDLDTALLGAHLDDDGGSASGSAYVFVRNGTTWSYQAKLTADDAAANDEFGFSVAVSGDTALVGAPRDGGSFVGFVSVFVRNGTTWSQQVTLTAFDAGPGDSFGWSIALSGDTALVGTPFEKLDAKLSGSVYMYEGSLLSTEAKLTASDAATNDRFGISVAISGTTALVGAHFDDDGGPDSGSAYVFVRSGTTWTQQAKLTANDASADDQFGFSVALSADTAIIGARFDDDAGASSGSAYVFVRNDTTWSQQARLTANDAAAGDVFGWSVALEGDTALVGAHQDDDAGSSSGSAYVFVRSGTIWSQQAKLTANDAAAGDAFGRAVALSVDTALVGARLDDDGGTDSGSVYVFVRSGTSWSQQAKLTPSDAAAGDQFAFSVALSGNTALVGSHRDDDGGADSGSAYVFVRSGTNWSQQAKLTANDAEAGDNFGRTVAFSVATALVGAFRDDDGGTNSGSAYVFVRSDSTWSQHAKLTASDAAAGDSFGITVALSGSQALVGAIGDDDGGASSGSAYVFGTRVAPVSLPTPPSLTKPRR